MAIIADNVYFHNVAELEDIPGYPGKSLQRFPRKVRDALERQGAYRAMQSSGCEIRFVTSKDYVRVVLSAAEIGGDVVVFQGDYFHSHHFIEPGKPTALILDRHEKFGWVDREVLRNTSTRFSPEVWRIFTSRFCAVFHGIEGFGASVRPPRPEEMPEKKWLIYGSSITHGSSATQNANAYPQIAARQLGVDVFNLGLSGSCRLERETCDFIAGRTDWDFAAFELGVNMRSTNTPEEFRDRASYFLKALIRNHPGKPLFLITIYPNAETCRNQESPGSINEARFNGILEELYQSLDHRNLHLIEGRDILQDLSYLTVDLIHPSDMGHMDMGYRLAAAIKPFLADQ